MPQIKFENSDTISHSTLTTFSGAKENIFLTRTDLPKIFSNNYVIKRFHWFQLTDFEVAYLNE
jgi:hypothetical protein